jgi:hypothetical protein
MRLSDVAGTLWGQIRTGYAAAGFPLRSTWSVPLNDADANVVRELEAASYIEPWTVGDTYRLTHLAVSEIWRS